MHEIHPTYRKLAKQVQVADEVWLHEFAAVLLSPKPSL